MDGSGTTTFTDPDDDRASVIGARINFVLTGCGDFKARLTWVKLRHLSLVRRQDNVPRIAFVTLPPKLVVVAFPTGLDPPQIWGGSKLGVGDIMLHSLGERIHQRTSGDSQWGFISLAPEELAAYGSALAGADLTPPPFARILRPPPVAAAHLLHLHAQACRLAETKPEIIAHRQVARALEQDLIHALIDCLTAGDERGHAPTRQRHAEIMIRFEDVLASHPDRQLPMPELCAAVGAPERTLRACCAEFLGMSPGSYARLRRLNLVRTALLRADPATVSIAEIARRYGFSELGRFAAVYRAAFGETPSTTLRGAGSHVRDPASAEFA